jgi:2-polyprenyl-3-methyl-5-hydroxy-6-metoxy-1,4-benzoquinol methylase
VSSDPTSYLPALRFHFLTRYFDAVLAATLKEQKFKSLLVKQADVHPGARVLDVGCGTGTLCVLLKKSVPEARVVGVDADRTALEIARRKAREAQIELELHEGLAWDAPFEPKSFDRIVSSLVLHHLKDRDKLRTLQQARTWLRPDGELHIADWGKAQNALMRLAFVGVQLLDGFETTTQNVRHGLVPLLCEAGFRSVEETHREMTLFGTLSLYRARRGTTAWPPPSEPELNQHHDAGGPAILTP